MSKHRLHQHVPSHRNLLQAEFGEELTLMDEDGTDPDTRYHILRELEMGGQHYAVLRDPAALHKDAYLFKVSQSEVGHRMEHVENEQEWEIVTDALEDLLNHNEI